MIGNDTPLPCGGEASDLPSSSSQPHPSCVLYELLPFASETPFRHCTSQNANDLLLSAKALDMKLGMRGARFLFLATNDLGRPAPLPCLLAAVVPATLCASCAYATARGDNN